MTQIHHRRAVVLLVFAGILCAVAAADFVAMWEPEVLFPSPALTATRMLSDYCPELKHTRADTKVYEFAGQDSGATMLVLGGTHPNEPAGFITATIILENAHLTAGRLIVIPQACASGFTCTDPLEGAPQTFTVTTRSGERTFRFGGRAANVVDQWPDPLVYLHYPSGQQLSGNETRNLNRAYPGRRDGTLTERTAFALVELIRSERVDLAVDLHEAAPEIPIINALITHEKGRDIAAAAVLDLEFEDLQFALELSPANFHGLSHREWGDMTETIPFLMETSNPIQGRLRGRTSTDLILNGVDPFYAQALGHETMRITYEPTGEPLARRVGRHMQGLHALIAAYNEQYADRTLHVDGLPTYTALMENGVKPYLR
jgi:hypothetical protein